VNLLNHPLVKATHAAADLRRMQRGTILHSRDRNTVRSIMRKNKPPAPRQVVPKACKHLGGLTGATVSCQSCGGSVQLKVYHCEQFIDCTIKKRVNGIGGCCDDGKCSKYEIAET